MEKAFVKIGIFQFFLVCAALLMAPGCIERAPTPATRRAQFDRSQLQSLLLRELPPTAQRMGATFGQAVELAAYDFFPREPRPGDAVEITFFWRVLRPPEVNYKVFVHGEARGAEGRINADHWPAERRYPTDVWQAGEIIRDRFPIKISQNFEGDALSVWTGFYRTQKPDERWPLTSVGAGQSDGKNRLRAVTIPIAGR